MRMVTFFWREFSVDQDLSMSVKAESRRAARVVRRVRAADAVVRARARAGTGGSDQGKIANDLYPRIYSPLLRKEIGAPLSVLMSYKTCSLLRVYSRMYIATFYAIY
jgi:hypothetical protein